MLQNILHTPEQFKVLEIFHFFILFFQAKDSLQLDDFQFVKINVFSKQIIRDLLKSYYFLKKFLMQ